MPEVKLPLSEYRGVWLFTMFDLPVTDPEARKRYAQFRNLLLEDGFEMLQFSVYARYFPSEEAAEPHKKKIKAGLPPDGHVRLLTVTDKQYGKMQVFRGKKSVGPETPPEQLVFF